MCTDSFSSSAGSVHVPWDSKYVVHHVSSVSCDAVGAEALGWGSGAQKNCRNPF